jgi:hypothetical protein
MSHLLPLIAIALVGGSSPPPEPRFHDGTVVTTVAVRVATAGSANPPKDAGQPPVDRNPAPQWGCRIDVEPILLAGPGTNVEPAEWESGVMNGRAAIRLHCSPGTSNEVAAGRGRNYEGGRRMRDDATAAYLRYELFLDPDHIVPWDEDRPLRGTAGAEAAARITVYARIHVEELAPHGQYADAIDVRVDYYGVRGPVQRPGDRGSADHGQTARAESRMRVPAGRAKMVGGT